jgi:putative flippase GtrA
VAQQLRLPGAALKLSRLLARPTRYAQIGLVCALLNNLIVIGFDRAGYHYALAVCVAFIATTAIGYALHAAYTFRVRRSGAALLRFFGANVSGFFISMLLMIALCDGIGLTPWLAMPIATVLLFAWNYALANWAIGGWRPWASGIWPAAGR